MSFWDEIDSQKNQAKNLNFLDDEYLSKTTSNKLFKKVIQDARNGKHGLVYHTKATGLPCHQWFLGDRVIVYLNPSPEHLYNKEYNKEYNINNIGLKQYIIKEFGCTIQFFKQLMDNELLFVKVDEKDKYPKCIQQQIEDLLKDHEGNVIFNKLVETSISSKLGLNDFDSLLKSEMNRVSINGLKLLKNQGAMTVRGVNWQDPLNKVKENYARMEILREYFSSLGKNDEKLTVERELKNFTILSNNAQEFAELAYDSYLHVGTPIYYSLASGTNSMGLPSLNQSRFSEVTSPNKSSVLFKLERKLFGRAIHQGNFKKIEQELESWGSEQTVGYYANIGLREENVKTLLRPYVGWDNPEILDTVVDLAHVIPRLYYVHTTVDYGGIAAAVNLGMLVYSIFRDTARRNESGVTIQGKGVRIPLKTGKKTNQMKQQNYLQLRNTKGFYGKVGFRLASFYYASPPSVYWSYSPQP